MNPIEQKKRLRSDPHAREGVTKALAQEAERVLGDDEEIEDKLRETASMPTSGLVQVSDKDSEMYSRAPVRTCGTCKFFNLKGGQREMIRQKFPERLVLDEQWALKHIGAPLDHAGLCDASGGQTMTTTVADASGCPGYRPRERLFRR